MTITEQILKAAEEKMCAWDDDLSNNDRFMDGEDAVAIIKLLAERLEANDAALLEIQNANGAPDDEDFITVTARQTIADNAVAIAQITGDQNAK